MLPLFCWSRSFTSENGRFIFRPLVMCLGFTKFLGDSSSRPYLYVHSLKVVGLCFDVETILACVFPTPGNLTNVRKRRAFSSRHRAMSTFRSRSICPPRLRCFSRSPPFWEERTGEKTVQSSQGTRSVSRWSYRFRRVGTRF